jgi:hypothetical protein
LALLHKIDEFGMTHGPHRRRLALLLALIYSATSQSARAADPGSSRHFRDNALLVGSSSIRQAFGRIIARALERRGLRVTRRGMTSVGLARPDYRDMIALANELPIDDQTAAVFVYLGVNDAQALRLLPRERRNIGRPWLGWSDRRWSAVYEERTRRFIEQLCASGARRVILLLPVDVVPERLQRRLDRIREIQARAAHGSSCGKAVRTGGDWGRFNAGGFATRSRDGFHMTAHGARVVWERIRAAALRGLVAREVL